jgi:hypothetical protein
MGEPGSVAPGSDSSPVSSLGPSPVDDVRFTRPLVRALRGHIDACAASMPEVPDDRRHRVAVAWVYTSALVAWAEDHALVDPWLHSAAEYVPDGVCQLIEDLSAVGWVELPEQDDPVTWRLTDGGRRVLEEAGGG